MGKALTSPERQRQLKNNTHRALLTGSAQAERTTVCLSVNKFASLLPRYCALAWCALSDCTCCMCCVTMVTHCWGGCFPKRGGGMYSDNSWLDRMQEGWRRGWRRRKGGQNVKQEVTSEHVMRYARIVSRVSGHAADVHPLPHYCVCVVWCGVVRARGVHARDEDDVLGSVLQGRQFGDLVELLIAHFPAGKHVQETFTVVGQDLGRWGKNHQHTHAHTHNNNNNDNKLSQQDSLMTSPLAS